MRTTGIFVAATVLAASFAHEVRPQTSPLFSKEWFHAIRDEASGELPLVDFQYILARFSGFTPSKGGDDMAEYIADRMREYGLDEVAVEGFPADGKSFFWAFLTEPAWEAESALLTMVEPRKERLADFSVHRVVLGRYSTSADVTTQLVDVGAGTSTADYESKDVRGKMVLANGTPGTVHREAVWGRGAVGVVWFGLRPELPHVIRGANLGNHTGGPGLVAWRGPQGEEPGFVFSLSHAAGMEIRQQLGRGETVTLHASVNATTGPGEYKQVSAAIRGTEPDLKEVWLKAHTNHRNTGGGNNLTGVGAIMEMARVLRTLIDNGTLPRPRRTIRFHWSAEHFVSTYQFHKHPEWLDRVFTFFSVDMTGFNQDKVMGAFRMLRTPHSKPHLLSDVGEEFVHSVGRANQNWFRHRGFLDPIFAPNGTRDEMEYRVEEFWAPSDHEEVVEASIGIPAVEFGHPDKYIGTQEDSIDKVDPTQMRRSVLTIASAAYYLASLSTDDIPRLVPVMTGYALARMGRDARRAFGFMEEASVDDFAVQYREALNILKHSLRRELISLDSLREIGQGPEVERAIARAGKQLEGVNAANDESLRERAAELAAAKKVALQEPAPSPAERQLDAKVPRRNPDVRGPVNLWRPEYGSIWIAQKTGNPDVLGQVNLTRKGRFVAYEALNFVDGKRSLLDIRDAVSAEYVPIDAADIEQYFRLLEQVGVVTIETARPSGR